MSIVIFLLLALVVGALIAYPLLPRSRGRFASEAHSARRTAAPPAPRCPACGRPHRAGDRFCVGCGATLSSAGTRLGGTPAGVPAEMARSCPSCGAELRSDDRFCGKCGHALPTEAP